MCVPAVPFSVTTGPFSLLNVRSHSLKSPKQFAIANQTRRSGPSPVPGYIDCVDRAAKCSCRSRPTRVDFRQQRLLKNHDAERHGKAAGHRPRRRNSFSALKLVILPKSGELAAARRLRIFGRYEAIEPQRGRCGLDAPADEIDSHRAVTHGRAIVGLT